MPGVVVVTGIFFFPGGFPRHAEQRQLVQCGWRIKDAVCRLRSAQG
jgi:hypothetical protein